MVSEGIFSIVPDLHHDPVEFDHRLVDVMTFFYSQVVKFVWFLDFDALQGFRGVVI